MKYFANKQIISHYHVIAFVFALLGLAIVGKTAYTMFFKRAYWGEMANRFVKDSVTVKPMRGNIYSADGQLLATSLPEYIIYLDYIVSEKDSVRREKWQHERDSLREVKLDSICEGLHRILPDKSVSWYKERIREGAKRKTHYWKIYPKRISFIDYKEIKKLPFFNLGPNKSGFQCEEFHEVKKPFGSLAARTIGEIDGQSDTARYGLQYAYDSLLRGTPGIVHRQRVHNRYLPIVDVPPVNGADIKTTIDVKWQDFCEKAIVDKLKEIGGSVGVVILMEVKTGDVKAIVNMTRLPDGEYYEVKNNALTNLMEPGSVFKPMSFMVAFEDRKISIDQTIDVGNGVRQMYGRKMKDHNWRRGNGYGVITVSECLEKSSNVGVSVLIDKNYHEHPEQFVNGLYKIGVAEDLKLDIPGYSRPNIRRPKADGSNWSKTALAWMSIGYETQMSPMSVLNFYNGVANNGKMMRPRFVTEALRDGEVIETFPPKVVREKMCSDYALKNIQTCLRRVVSRGLGNRAGSPNFSVSGKTGTAQVWGKGGFTSSYLISFAGYFPSEAPKYSCIVCIEKHGLPASGGLHCGPVFRQVAEMVMSTTAEPSLEAAKDTVHSLVPLVDYGNLVYANRVLNDINVTSDTDWTPQDAAHSVWGRAESSNRRVKLHRTPLPTDKVPDVKGMGARDAIYLLEKLGMHVKLQGFGKVVSQSVAAGHQIKRGSPIVLQLRMQGARMEDFVEETDETPDSTAVKPDSTSAKAKAPAVVGVAAKSVEQEKKPAAN